MSQAPAAPPPSRPTLIDYFILLTGCAVSLALFRIHVLRVEPAATATPAVRSLVGLLPDLLRLPEGIILMWPVLYSIQRACGRTQGLTIGEWLWVFAWLTIVPLAGFAAWYHFGTLPELFQVYHRGPFLIWHFIAQPSMALVAIFAAAFGAFDREPRPWTDPLAHALMIWPLLPLGGILAFATLPTKP